MVINWLLKAVSSELRQKVHRSSVTGRGNGFGNGALENKYGYAIVNTRLVFNNVTLWSRLVTH